MSNSEVKSNINNNSNYDEIEGNFYLKDDHSLNKTSQYKQQHKYGNNKSKSSWCIKGAKEPSPKSVHGSKKWSRLVSETTGELNQEKFWPSLGEGSNATKFHTSKSVDKNGRNFLNAVKYPKHDKKCDTITMGNKFTGNNGLGRDERIETVSVIPKSGHNNHGGNTTRELSSKVMPPLENNNNNSKFEIDEENPWENVRLKKSTKTIKAPVAVVNPTADATKTSVNSKKVKVKKEAESEKDEAAIAEQRSKKNVLKKILINKEKQQLRQRKILREREAARSDTKVNLISRETITGLLNKNSNKTKKLNIPIETPTYEYQMAEYPSLNIKKNHKIIPLPVNVTVNNNCRINIKRELNNKLTSKLNEALNEGIDSPSISYSSAVSAVTDINLVPTKFDGNFPKKNSSKVKPLVVSPKKIKFKDPIPLDLLSYIKGGKNSSKKNSRSIDNAVKFRSDGKSKVSSTVTPSVVSKKVKMMLPSQLHRGRNTEVKKKSISTIKKVRIRERKSRAESFIQLLAALKHEAISCDNPADMKPELKSQQFLTAGSFEDVKLKLLTRSSSQPISGTIKVEPGLGIDPNDIEVDSKIKDEPLTESDLHENADTPDSLQLEDNNNKFEVPLPITKIESNSQIVSTNLKVEKFKNDSLRKTCVELVQEINELQNTVHNRHFREYCNQCVTPEVNNILAKLIKTIVGFQDRLFHKDPIRAKTRRRYYCGLNETYKHMNKMTCIVMAPSVQRGKGPGGLEEKVYKMLNGADERSVPVIFGLNCHQIGRLCRKFGSASCMGIVNYQGAQEYFNSLMDLMPQEKLKYQQLLSRGLTTKPLDVKYDSCGEEEVEDRTAEANSMNN